ncbi:MAG: nicotinate (nicotinamide) nucleotide adenylyltransferase [Rikenellaceae bacterium]
MKVSLFFGSFNPIHYGHIAIAESIISGNYADEVWLVVSPQNPLKEGIGTTKEKRAQDAETELQRLSLDKKIKVCRIEFNMPIPSYTIDTLNRIMAENPETEFSIVMGEDNLRAFDQWKDYKTIANMVRIYVYPREGNDYKGISELNPEILELNAIEYIKGVNLLNISSSAIREAKLLYEKGVEFQEKGQLDKALNEFLVAQELTPNNPELNTRIEMIQSIFNFSYKEFINV